MESLIEACNVTDAKEVYEILGQEKIEISIQLKQDYLEMLCFHNSNDEEMEEDFNDTKGIITVNQNKWIAGKYITPARTLSISRLNSRVLKLSFLTLKMMVKSGLEFILKFIEPLQRYLLRCQANSAILGRYFCTGQQQL